MSRSVEEWRGKDDDTPVPPRVRARVFLDHDGICHISKRKIRPGELWECDHVVAIINGGENRERNLAPALKEKHREKTDTDMDTKSKIARQRAGHLGLKPKGLGWDRTKTRGFDGKVRPREARS